MHPQTLSPQATKREDLTAGLTTIRLCEQGQPLVIDPFEMYHESHDNCRAVVEDWLYKHWLDWRKPTHPVFPRSLKVHGLSVELTTLDKGTVSGVTGSTEVRVRIRTQMQVFGYWYFIEINPVVSLETGWLLHLDDLEKNLLVTTESVIGPLMQRVREVEGQIDTLSARFRQPVYLRGRKGKFLTEPAANTYRVTFTGTKAELLALADRFHLPPAD